MPLSAMIYCPFDKMTGRARNGQLHRSRPSHSRLPGATQQMHYALVRFCWQERFIVLLLICAAAWKLADADGHTGWFEASTKRTSRPMSEEAREAWHARIFIR